MKKFYSIFIIIFIGIGYFYFSYQTQIKKKQLIFFAITSHGGTGTTWLSSVLNSRPEISCSHYIHNQTGDQTFKHRKEVPIEDFLAWQEQSAKLNAWVIGNVHGYTLEVLLPKLKETPYPDLKIMNIIRHPVSQLESVYHHWKDKIHGIDRTTQYLQGIHENDNNYHGDIPFDLAIPYVEKIKKYLKIDAHTNPDMWLFLCALGAQDAVHKDMKTAIELHIPQIKFEEMTKDKMVMDYIIRYISNNTVILDDSSLEKLVTTPPKNRNNHPQLSEQERFNTWEDWKKFAFYLHLLNSGGINNNAYVDVGYDLSFINKDDWERKIKSH